MKYTQLSAFALASLALFFCTGLAIGQVTVRVQDGHLITTQGGVAAPHIVQAVNTAYTGTDHAADEGTGLPSPIGGVGDVDDGAKPEGGPIESSGGDGDDGGDPPPPPPPGGGYQNPLYRLVTGDDRDPPPPPPAGGGYQYASNVHPDEGTLPPIFIIEEGEKPEEDGGTKSAGGDGDDGGDPPPPPPPGGGYQRLIAAHGAVVERDPARGLYRVWLPGSTDPVLDFFTIITTDRVGGQRLLETFGDVTIIHPGALDAAQYRAVIQAANQAKRLADVPPETAALTGNYPNPFNPETTIRFRLATRQAVRLSVYNALGQRVQVLVEGTMAAGPHEARFAAYGLPSGTYFTRLETEAGVQTRSIILMK